jgi:hypothetical protein
MRVLSIGEEAYDCEAGINENPIKYTAPVEIN